MESLVSVLNGNIRLEDALYNAFNNIRNGINHMWSPPVDIVEDCNGVYIYIEIPNVERNSIHVDIKNTKLTVHGIKVCPYRQDNMELHHNEIPYGDFEKAISIPVYITDKKQVSFSTKDGILLIAVDKRFTPSNHFEFKGI